MRFPFSKPIAYIVRLWQRAPRGKLLRLCQRLFWRSLPTIIAVIVVLPAIYLNFLQPIEFWAYDSFANWRGDRAWDNRIVIIAIDDLSISKLGRFPWQRDRYTQLLQTLMTSEASVIGFDILWSETSPEDQQLSQVLEQYQNIVLATAWDNSGKFLPPVFPIASNSLGKGHILKREDADGVVRQVDLQLQNIPTLSVAMIDAYNLSADQIVPLPDLQKPFWVNWTNRVKTIPQVSFDDVLENKISPSTFRDKIVLVGVTASGIDNLVTPFDRNPPASGVHLHGMVLQNLLQNNSLKIASSQVIWSFALLGSLFLGLILPRRNLWLSSLSAFMLSALWFAIAFVGFMMSYWLAIALPILMMLLTGFAIAVQERWQSTSALKSASSQIHYNTTHDLLTGLFNRTMLAQRLDNLLKTPNLVDQKSDHDLAVLWINIDRFKNINDIFGHSSGSSLLIEISKLLQSLVPSPNLVARFSGAEFVVLLENFDSKQSVMAIADRIQSSLQVPFLIQGNEISLSANMGIRFHPLDPLNSQTIIFSEENNSSDMISSELILRDAETAMFQAQKLGNSYCKIFELSMRERIIERLQLEKDLRVAVAIAQDLDSPQQQFQTYYQPILCLHEMKIVGLEALIRWQHPDHGLISPIHFIPLAEETGLIVPIGDWIMRTACSQVKDWQQRFDKAKDISISVNLAPKQLAQDDVIEKCLTILQETGLSPEYLKIELTEGSIMENLDFSFSVLNKLRQAGIKIYIDDFGTGYSSLAYLHKFTFDGLKIDRSFVNHIHTDVNGMEILQAIVSLAQSVKAHIVAEGIENLDQLNYLQSLLSDGDGQGFFLFRPLDVLAVEKIFEAA